LGTPAVNATQRSAQQVDDSRSASSYVTDVHHRALTTFPPSLSWAPWVQYALALGAVIVALGLRWLFNPVLEDKVPFVTIFPALLLVALSVRADAFLAASAIALFGTLVLFVRPRFSLVAVDRAELVQLVLFGLAVATTALATWLSQRAQERRRHVEQELVHSSEELRLITDAVPALISYVDTELRYRFVNAGYFYWFGRRSEEIIGKSLAEVLGEAAFEHVKPYVEAALAGQRCQFESELPYKTGARHVLGEYVPNVRADGTVAGFYVLVTDISGLKQAEAALKDADRRKDEFLATLAHELRNPLAAIRSSTELLGGHLNREQLGHVTAIMKRQVGLMVRLIDDLLDVSRITHGTIELRTERAQLISLVNQALDAAQPWLERKGHNVEIEAPVYPLEVEGDPVRLVQVFTNMLSNACRYTDPGGRISVRIARDGDAAVVEVRDNGTGIPPDKLDAIFEMFSRLDSPNGRSGGCLGSEAGLGIGLALSRRLVEMHGGTMTASSEGPGHGSQFTVRLPARPPAPATDVRPEPAGDNQVHRILIVDDNVDAANSLALLLSTRGYATRTAYDGTSALAEAAAFQPEVLVLDLGLPDIDGTDVCRNIRSEPWGKDVFVVALSGWGQERDKRRTAEAGFDAHLTKPAELDDLITLMANRTVPIDLDPPC
jgi:PAS domain S-box-containing protein